MIELKFKHCSLDEVVLYRIDRVNKKFWLSSSKTNYNIVESKWLNLFDKRKEKAQDKITENFTDEQFIALIILEMMKAGYENIGSTNRKAS